MKPKLLLRLAGVLMFLHTIGHSIGALTWKTAPNAAIANVIAGMQNIHFNFMGRVSTIASYYHGYGIMMIFVLLLITVLLWLLSNETGLRLTYRLMAPITLFLVLLAIAEYVYFFPFAALLTSLAAICSLFACIRMSPLNSL